MLSALAKESISIFEGLVEVDETYLLESHKGRRVLPNLTHHISLIIFIQNFYPKTEVDNYLHKEKLQLEL